MRDGYRRHLTFGSSGQFCVRPDRSGKLKDSAVGPAIYTPIPLAYEYRTEDRVEPINFFGLSADIGLSLPCKELSNNSPQMGPFRIQLGFQFDQQIGRRQGCVEVFPIQRTRCCIALSGLIVLFIERLGIADGPQQVRRRKRIAALDCGLPVGSDRSKRHNPPGTPIGIPKKPENPTPHHFRTNYAARCILPA